MILTASFYRLFCLLVSYRSTRWLEAFKDP
jgi:hypothetical protein